MSQHWLTNASRCLSPNQNPRPQNSQPELLVIHNISLPPGQFGGGHVQQLFCNQLDAAVHPYFAEIEGLQVSAHLLIERDGTLVQFVAFDQRAWHAGVSCFEGRDGCNDFSIGIELEGTDDQPYSDDQYQQLNGVIRQLLQCYPGLSSERIVGHNDIAPGRKTDPGEAFDWPRLQRLLAAAEH
ncbi:MAG: 1,6-anhydro-N-acetylmuramyl-L-alanine amidase AmpD [Motiliproteus sp.]